MGTNLQVCQYLSAYVAYAYAHALKPSNQAAAFRSQGGYIHVHVNKLRK